MRIYVVDPSRTVLKAVSRLLEDNSHVVQAFLDGFQALDALRSDPAVDALITSAELTSMSGAELCWEARLLAERQRAIYILLMSSNSDRTSLAEALDSGADDFIGKPLIKEELYARLRSAERTLALQRELIRQATIDPLTGVFNRRAFFDRAQRLCRPRTSAEWPAAIMFDVDHFKRVNDTYGHDIGDEVLRSIGTHARGEGGVVGRLGGEEFAILLEGTALEACADHAERLRDRLGTLRFETTQGQLSVTCSFGIAAWQAGETIDQLLKRADSALYRAKTDGRNRVVKAPAAPTDAPSARVRGSDRAAAVHKPGL